jgi:hypothetical protein
MADSTTVVVYDATNYGKVYLGDVGQRNQLGTGRGIYSHGQDRYLHHVSDGTAYKHDATFLSTSDVLLSKHVGRIAKMNRDMTANTFRAFTVVPPS